MLQKISAALLGLLLCAAPALAAEGRVITDMRGKSVTIPADPKRIATIDDGFVEGLLTHLGEIERVAVIGSWSMKRDYKYDFETVSGESYTLRGWNTMKLLHPWLDNLPCVAPPQSYAVTYEALAVQNPDLVIVRVGDCTVSAGDKDAAAKTVARLEEMGFPLVVTYAPAWFQGHDLSTMRDEAGVIGSIFGKKAEAEALMDKLAGMETMVRERTRNIPEAEKSRVLYMGLNPGVRKNGGAGTAHGVDTAESYIIEQVAGAKNAWQGKGSGVPMSAEQIYALDPDVIVLPTSNGYHPPRELMEAPYYVNMAELRAVKAKKVYAMPWSPMNCSRRLEYPLDMLIIAKAAYPERFQDISVYDFALQLYKDLYHVDDAKAAELRSTQILDWMKDTGF